MRSLLSATRQPPLQPDDKGRVLESASFRDLRLVATSIGIATVVALVLVGAYAVRLVGWSFTLQMTWAVGIWCAAMLLGFLFGIPKVLQGQNGPTPPPPATSAPGSESGAASASTSASVAIAYRQRVNTNLEDISDWLTKIIVGVTLVQLKQLPAQFNALADQIVGNVTSPGNHRGFGLAMIVAFATLGFLFGYLVTRLYIQGALFRAERGLDGAEDEERERRRQVAETSSALLSQITELIAGAGAQGAQVAPGPPPDDVRETLARLSNQYKDIQIGDWRERLDAKNALAAKLFAYAAANAVSRDWLASQGDEVLILALAGAVQAAPTAEDATRLLRAAPRVTRKHVQYWIVLALSRLIELGLLSRDERAQVTSMLDQYNQTADDSLKRLIASVRKQL
jgi:hypothetical protein